MFSNRCVQQIEMRFERLIPFLGDKKEEILSGIGKYPADEAAAIKFLYGAMPLSDIGNYKMETYADYARHGVHLWKNSPYSSMIPEDIFLNYVMHHRVNEEEISECRSFFYGKLAERIAGMSMKEAVLEVNYWCLEEATYRTTDERTASPMTVYRSGYGRCGEESTFTVSALRSVGIPARQIYVPRWSHCDDNHAWVEAWCDGEWHFIGACEPEPILNKGWFTNASSRAVLAHTRWFIPSVQDQGDESSGYPNGEDVIGKDGMVTMINTTSNYALAEEVTIKITDQEGKSAEHARVDFEVLNYSEFFPAASMIADEKGCVKIELGLGNVHVHVSCGGSYAEMMIDTRKEKYFEIQLNGEMQEEEWINFDVIAPEDYPLNSNLPTEVQKMDGARRTKEADEKRYSKVERFYQEAEALKTAGRCENGDRILEILKESRGNFEEIRQFILAPADDMAQSYKVKMLDLLTDKDYRDCRSRVLQEHLEHAIDCVGKYEEDIFVDFVLNPRIHQEPMTAYRKFIQEFYGAEQKETFRSKPELLWEDIGNRVREWPDMEYSPLITSPEGCLRMGAGSLLSKKILFVAACRTLGIPARLKMLDLSMEYYKNGHFVRLECGEHDTGTVRLYPEKSGESWICLQNWSIGVLKNGRYCSLNMPGRKVDADGMELSLSEGTYRMITSNRIPNGNILAKKYYFSIEKEMQKKIFLSLRETELKDMIVNIPIQDFELISEEKGTVSAQAIGGNHKRLFLWLEESREPTEHILNELFENREAFHRLDADIVFVTKDKSALSDPTISRTLAALPRVKVYYDHSEENAETISRRMYVEPGKLPLIVAMKDGLTGIYATTGYNVGTGDMLLKIFNMIL